MTGDLNVSDVACELRIRRAVVVVLLTTGQLAGYDVSLPGARRKSYRITREALDAFKAGRSAKAPEPPKREYRQKRVQVVREFF